MKTQFLLIERKLTFFKGKDLQVKILNEITQFDTKANKLKVIIMDLCNENGTDKYSFGFNFNASQQ